MPTSTSSPAWRALEKHRDEIATHRVDAMFAADPGRGPAFTFPCAGLAVDFSKQRIAKTTLDRLVALARERDVAGAIERLFTGERVNVTEDRAALHTAMRGDERVVADGEDVLAHVQRCRERMRVFATAVRDGSWRGASGEKIRHVLALGIGGSYLGPRLVAEALAAQADGPTVRFLANIDPAALDDALAGLDPATTLVVVASKTFTTQETMANASAARRWIVSALGEGAVARHFVAATANAAGGGALRAAGVQRVSLRRMDRRALFRVVQRGTARGHRAGDARLRALPRRRACGGPRVPLRAPERNVPLLLALVGVWNRDFLAIGVHAVLPYAQRLASLPGYLQQLEMESNGKRVTASGEPVAARPARRSSASPARSASTPSTSGCTRERMSRRPTSSSSRGRWAGARRSTACCSPMRWRSRRR